ncbi:hypothetical protein GCM10022223_23940 [Kineosporia mesophila]|uniref:PIN domain-containing protein n=1 Tax=Kineosporia mesophila TaxID=566012 RepID=A0ABP6ZEL5_9ACTN|nr:PIN domain-containing protein [Kineosporia mesophila]MCD5354228.1 PIN domain-containing protein [Kineosporia mesophila]
MSPAALSVFIDANILWSKCLADWVNLCAIQKNPVFHVTWSEDVLAEVRYGWRQRNPGASERALSILLERFRAFHPKGRVTGYNPRDYPRPTADEHDWHVLAAAAHAGADILLTDDTSAFTPECVEDRFIVHTADKFLLMLLSESPSSVGQAFEFQRQYFERTYGYPPEYLLQRLEKAGALSFAEKIPQVFPHFFEAEN